MNVMVKVRRRRRLGTFMAVLLLAACAHEDLNDERPNILIIVADDMGFSDVGSFGGEIPTPNLDKLAADGLRFRQFYNNAKCSPTRASLLSGQDYHDTGTQLVTGPNLGQILSDAGYRTYAVGKWHLQGNPVDRGFDRYFGHLGGATDYFLGDDSFRLDGEPWNVPSGFYATPAYADFAIEFLQEGHTRDPHRPFFMYLAHSAPHWPLQALPEDIDLFADAYADGWDVLHDRRVRAMRATGILDPDWPIPARPTALPAWESLSPKGKVSEAQRMAVYAAMVHRLDAETGRVLQAIEDLGELDNTLVIFLSDNGASPLELTREGVLGEAGSDFSTGLGWAWLNSAPFRYYKRTQHNGGIASPTIVHWPAGIETSLTGAIADQAQHVIDIVPTVLELTGAPYPGDYADQGMAQPAGVSFAGALRGDARGQNDRSLYFQFHDHWAVIRGNMKLVVAWSRPMELYDLAADRAETTNLVEDHAELARAMYKEWLEWAESRNVVLKPTRNHPHEPEYVPYASPATNSGTSPN